VKQMEIDKRFVFSGSAVGAAAHFFHLDHVPVDHVVPTIGSSTIPIVGGHTHHKVGPQTHSTDHPRTRTLLSVEQAETIASGKEDSPGKYSTEISATVNGLSVLEKFHTELIVMHQTSTRDEDAPESSIKTAGCKIEGLRLGNVAVKVELDEEPFATCGTKKELNAFYAAQSDAWRRENSWRFHTPPEAKSITEYHGRFFCTLVKNIELSGTDGGSIEKEWYTIKWDGFGRIFLGELIISDKDRKVTMVRLKMGSSGGGKGSAGGGETNSGTAP